MFAHNTMLFVLGVASLTSSTAAATSKNYVILSAARSSSTYACRMMTLHPDAQCYGEMLQPNYQEGLLRHNAFYKPQDREDHVRDLSAIDRVEALLTDQLCEQTGVCFMNWTLVDYCQDQAQCEQHKSMAKGFKVFYTHPHLEDVMNLCEKHDIPVIHLVRASGFRRHISGVIARMRGTFELDKAPQAHADEGPEDEGEHAHSSQTHGTVSISAAKKDMDNHAKSVKFWSEKLSERNIRHKTIFYEEMRLRQRFLPAAQEFSEVYSFIGLDPKRAGPFPEREQESASNTYSSTLNYASMITNIDQLRKEFPFDTCELEYGSIFE